METDRWVNFIILIHVLFECSVPIRGRKCVNVVNLMTDLYVNWITEWIDRRVRQYVDAGMARNGKCFRIKISKFRFHQSVIQIERMHLVSFHCNGIEFLQNLSEKINFYKIYFLLFKNDVKKL